MSYNKVNLVDVNGVLARLILPMTIPSFRGFCTPIAAIYFIFQVHAFTFAGSFISFRDRMVVTRWMLG